MDKKLPIEIEVKNIGHFNYTFCLNKLAFIHEIVIKNIEDCKQNLKVEITSSLGIFDPYNLHIDEISNKHLINQLHEHCSVIVTTSNIPVNGQKPLVTRCLQAALSL